MPEMADHEEPSGRGLFGGVFARGDADTSDVAWLQAMLDAEAGLARALERAGTVTVSAAAPPLDGTAPDWAVLRHWPAGTVHGLCTPLRSRGRTVGVLTFLRGPTRSCFDRADIAYAEDVAARVAGAVDLADRAQKV